MKKLKKMDAEFNSRKEINLVLNTRAKANWILFRTKINLAAQLPYIKSKKFPYLFIDKKKSISSKFTKYKEHIRMIKAFYHREQENLPYEFKLYKKRNRKEMMNDIEDAYFGETVLPLARLIAWDKCWLSRPWVQDIIIKAGLKDNKNTLGLIGTAVSKNRYFRKTTYGKEKTRSEINKKLRAAIENQFNDWWILWKFHKKRITKEMYDKFTDCFSDYIERFLDEDGKSPFWDKSYLNKYIKRHYKF